MQVSRLQLCLPTLNWNRRKLCSSASRSQRFRRYRRIKPVSVGGAIITGLPDCGNTNVIRFTNRKGGHPQ